MFFGIKSAIMAAATVALGSSAFAGVVVDGYTWDYAYTGTGDVLPSASTPVWTDSDSSGGLASVLGGELTIDTTTVDGRYFQIDDGTEWNPNSSDVAYVQFRAKVNSQAAGARMAGTLYVGGEAQNIQIALGTYDDGSGVKTGAFNSKQINIAQLDVSQYHTYRVAFNPSASAYTLWIDDFTPANYVASGSTFGSGNMMFFGDGSGDHRGSMTWDYVAWNNTSAPVAVPEPAALGLLGAGGLLALRRRRMS